MKKHLGFSLLELLLVLAIAATIVTMAVRYFSVANTGAQVLSATKRIEALIEASHSWLASQAQENFKGTGTTSNPISISALQAAGLISSQDITTPWHTTISLSYDTANPNLLALTVPSKLKTTCCALAAQLKENMQNTDNQLCASHGSTQCTKISSKYNMVGAF